jgi:hypothetical protein
MTNEEKSLLLKDLCARFPYGVIINSPSNIFYPSEREDVKLDSVFEIDNNFYATEDSGWPIETCKPYLRPMSSMTEEEKKEFKAFHCVSEWHPEFYQAMCNLPNINNMINWLDKKMFDHRGLIPKGLALEAKEGMYNLN